MAGCPQANVHVSRDTKYLIHTTDGNKDPVSEPEALPCHASSGKVRKSAANAIATVKAARDNVKGDEVGGHFLLYLLYNVPLDDFSSLGIDARLNHPVNMVFTAYPVLPPAVRPSAHMPTTKSVGNTEAEGSDDVPDDVAAEDAPQEDDVDVEVGFLPTDQDVVEEEEEAIDSPIQPPNKKLALERPPTKKLHQHTYLQAAASMAACLRNARTSRRSRVLVVCTPSGGILAEDETTTKLRSLLEHTHQQRNEPHLEAALAKTYYSSRTIESIMLGQLPPLGNSAYNKMKSGTNGFARTSSIRESLSRKGGVVRQQCLGKRMNNSARAPISNDPWISTNTVLVPQLLLKTFRVDRIMTAFERSRLEAWIRVGKVHAVFFQNSKHPLDVKRMCKLTLPTKVAYSVQRLLPTHTGNTGHYSLTKVKDAPSMYEIDEWYYLKIGTSKQPLSNFVEIPHIPDGAILQMEPMLPMPTITIRQPTMYSTSMPTLNMLPMTPNINSIMLNSSTVAGMHGDFDRRGCCHTTAPPWR